MDVQITGRHLEVTEAMRRHVGQHVEKLEHLDGRIQFLKVVLGTDSGSSIAELQCRTHRHDLIAESRAHDVYQAIDEAFARMTRQVSKLHEQRVSHRTQGPQKGAQVREASE